MEQAPSCPESRVATIVNWELYQDGWVEGSPAPQGDEDGDDG